MNSVNVLVQHYCYVRCCVGGVSPTRALIGCCERHTSKVHQWVEYVKYTLTFDVLMPAACQSYICSSSKCTRAPYEPHKVCGRPAWTFSLKNVFTWFSCMSCVELV